ncbi:tail tape measure protein [Pseudomonas sp. 1152_12]|uniref:tail tape measure protein n=1 Tax=Pseudomonas sp. 1152_12 TaxID=2604455 RepID=UPI0040646257
MQETQFQTRLAQQDKRWMLGDADLGNVLAPFSVRLAAPVSLNAAPQPQPQPQPQSQSQLSSALVTVSVDINALTLEQVRLRETLETLTSTLFITGATLAGTVGGTAASEAKNTSKGQAPADESSLIKFLKWSGEGLTGSFRTKVSDKTIEGTLGRVPGIGALFKGASKGNDGCCPGVSEALRGRERFGPKNTPARKGAGRSRLAGWRNTSSKTTSGFTATVRSLFERVGKAFEGPRLGFHSGASTQGVSPRPSQPPNRLGANAARNLAPGKGVGLIEALDRGLVPMPGQVSANPPQPASPTPLNRAAGAVPSVSAPATSRLANAMTRLGSVGARRLGPLRYADTAINVIQGVRNGDAKAVGSGLSSAGGAWAGASAGAAIGTLVFPGVGTAIGGAIGGLLGSEAGAWLGDKLFSSSDRLPAPAAVSKELNSARTDNVQVTLAPSIQITGVNPADAQHVVNQVIQALQFQCMPMVTDSLGIRRNAALADPSGGD